MPASSSVAYADIAAPAADLAPAARPPSEPGYSLIKRNGGTVPFDQSKVAVALTKAFLAVEGNKAAASRRVHEIVEDLTAEVVAALIRRAKGERVCHIEDVQDQVELALMRGEHQKVAAPMCFTARTAPGPRRKDGTCHVAPAFRMADVRRSTRRVSRPSSPRPALVSTAPPPTRSSPRPIATSTTASRRMSWRSLPSSRRARWSRPSRTMPMFRPACSTTSCAESAELPRRSPDQATQAEMATRYANTSLPISNAAFRSS